MNTRKETTPRPEPASDETAREPQGTTRSPADADIDRIRPIKPGRADEKTSEAGGVD